MNRFTAPTPDNLILAVAACIIGLAVAAAVVWSSM